MKFVYSEGGRSKYYDAIKVWDCVTRAICNATGKDYKEVYDLINSYASSEKRTNKSTARNWVSKGITYIVLTDMRWIWVPTMFIGRGCQVHLNENELPNGIIIVSVSKHLVCVKDGVLYDTFNCTRGGRRSVYGYYTLVLVYIYIDTKI